MEDFVKYRNGTTNLGVISGFGRMDDQGNLHVHQNSCVEMAYVFELGEAARPAAYEYEPVTVIFQAIPSATSTPSFKALHVYRMTKDAVPRSFIWSSRKWAINLPFYPFPVGTNDQLTPEIMESLADEHDLPQWLQDEIERDPSVAEIVINPASSKRLRSRLMITGYVSNGIHPGAQPLDEGRQRRILFKQPGDNAAIPLLLPMGAQGCKGLADMAANNEPTPVTLLVRPSMHAIMAPVKDQEVVESTFMELTILEIGVVNATDFQA